MIIATAAPTALHHWVTMPASKLADRRRMSFYIDWERLASQAYDMRDADAQAAIARVADGPDQAGTCRTW